MFTRFEIVYPSFLDDVFQKPLLPFVLQANLKKGR